MVQDKLVLDHKSRPKSQKKLSGSVDVNHLTRIFLMLDVGHYKGVWLSGDSRYAMNGNATMHYEKKNSFHVSSESHGFRANWMNDWGARTIPIGHRDLVEIGMGIKCLLFDKSTKQIGNDLFKIQTHSMCFFFFFFVKVPFDFSYLIF